MSARAAIETEMRAVAAEQGKALAPLSDDLVLLDSGLDSLCFAILVARLEETRPVRHLRGRGLPRHLWRLRALL